MTVGELIAELELYAPNTPVVVPGYETGLDDICRISLIAIRVREWNRYIPDYDGQHIPEKDGEMAVLLEGRHSTLADEASSSN